MKDKRTFFEKFGASELGTTKTVNSGLVSGVLGTRGQQQKMIDVSVEDAGACPVIVSARVEYQNDAGGVSQIGGPIVGIVQWGVGGGENQVEFDIPSARLAGFVAPIGAGPGFQPMNQLGNGAQIYLGAASHVSVYVRHDGYMSSLANTLNNNALGLGPTDYIGSPVPAKVIVHLQPATGSGQPPVERTVVVAGGMLDNPPAAPVVTDYLTPGNAIGVSIPPFGRCLRVQRIPFGTPIHLRFTNNFGVTIREYDLGPNDEGPVRIDAASDMVFVQNTGAANIIKLQCVFDVPPA